jgi:hypothetical protein
LTTQMAMMTTMTMVEPGQRQPLRGWSTVVAFFP